jgi:hypothetical protein
MATYIRLTDYKSSDEKEQEFFNPENRYEEKQEDFSKIPGNPIAYWVSKRTKEIFDNSDKLRDFDSYNNAFKGDMPNTIYFKMEDDIFNAVYTVYLSQKQKEFQFSGYYTNSRKSSLTILEIV